MINYFLLIFPLLLISTIISCTNAKSGKDKLPLIDIEANINKMKQIYLSQFTDNINYAPLKTKENLFFTGVGESTCKEGLILMKDLNKCIVYDLEGNIISKIGNKGRGPGEYSFVTNVGISSNKNIYMQSEYDLLEYNLDGSFLNKHNNTFLIHDKYFITSWNLLNDSLFFGHVPNSLGNTEYKALIFDKYGHLVHSFNNYILFNRERKASLFHEKHAHIYHFHNSIFYKDSYNDTMFYLNEKNDLIPSYVFNLGSYKEPLYEREKVTGHEWSNYIYILNVFQTSNYLLIKFQFNSHFPVKRITPRQLPNTQTVTWYNTSYILGLFNKKTGEFIFCKPTETDNQLFTTGLFNDFDAGPRFIPSNQINDSTMIMLITAKQLKDHVASDDFKINNPKYPEKKKELEDLANSLTEFDNPVLMIVTFKNNK